MTSILEFVKKYGPWVIAVLAVIWNFNALVAHWIPVDNSVVAQIDVILGFLGLGSFRIALAQAFAGIDLGPVGTWLTGKKTLIIAAGGFLFQLGAAFWGWSLDTPWVQFVNELAGALGVGTLLHAVHSYTNEAVKRVPESTSLFTK